MSAAMLAGCGGGKETSAPAAADTASQPGTEEAGAAEEPAPAASEIDFDEEPYEVVMEYMYFGNLR